MGNKKTMEMTKQMQDKIVKYLEALQKNKRESLKVLEGPLSADKSENKSLEIQVMILRAEVNQLDGIMDAIKTLL